MKVLMKNTSSTSFAEVLMLFQKNNFSHKLLENNVKVIDDTELDPEIWCLFEKDDEF